MLDPPSCPPERIGGGDKAGDVLRLVTRVARQGYVKLRRRQGTVKIGGGYGGAHDIVTALHDDGGYVGDAGQVGRLQQKPFPREEPAVDEVVVLDPRECQREVRVTIPRRQGFGGIRNEPVCPSFPQ